MQQHGSRIDRRLWVRAMIVAAVFLIQMHLFLHGSGLAYGKDAEDSEEEQRQAGLTGVIAYLTDSEIRAVNADGTEDRSVWALPTTEDYAIHSLAWNPTGTLLAFTANHEGVCSRFDYDIFTVRPDGTDLRRVTNAPACAQLSGFAQGMVEVTLQNTLVDFSIFAVHVEGALTAELVTISPGETRTVTLPHVADYGEGHQQFVTVISGHFRWFSPSSWVDVVPTDTRSPSSTFVIGQGGTQGFGAQSVTWDSDGTQLGFVLGQGLLQKITASPTPGTFSESLFSPDKNAFGARLAWSKTTDEVIYSDVSGIYVGNVAQDAAGTRLIDLESANLVYGIEWLPDNSGFVFGVTEGEFFAEYGNIYEYNFAANELTNLTGFTDEFASFPSVSPDGQYVVFARANTLEEPTSLWIVERATGAFESLGVQGIWPSWGQPAEVEAEKSVFLPLVSR